MKKNLFPLATLFAVVSSLAMLFFTFFTLAWFSDVRGWEYGFEMQINTAEGTVTTAGDVFWTLAPFFLVLSVWLGLFWGKGKKISSLLATLPLSLYSLCQIVLFFGGKETRLPTWITLFFLITVGIFTIAADHFPELEKFALLFPLVHFAAELLLFLLSFLLQQKLSAFYFSELLPMGHTSYFRYTFVVWSILFYYLSYALSLTCIFVAKKTKDDYFASKASPPPETPPNSKVKTEIPKEDEDGESLEGITLQDLGIER